MPASFAATIPDALTFAISAVAVLGGALGVIVARNAVHAALSLVLTLFGIAVLFIEQDASFLAAVQVIVYAGAIVVLFLFVIMFLGVDRQEDIAAEPLRGQRPLALLLVAVALGGVIALGVSAHWATGVHAVAGSTTAGHRANVVVLGRAVFTTYLYAFEATSALLVIAVVGAVVLAKRPRMDQRRPQEPLIGEDSLSSPDGGPSVASPGSVDRRAEEEPVGQREGVR
jgi:NADH-quinone oxidoreductase subunit J